MYSVKSSEGEQKSGQIVGVCTWGAPRRLREDVALVPAGSVGMAIIWENGVHAGSVAEAKRQTDTLTGTFTSILTA